MRDCTERDGSKRPTMKEIVERLDAIGRSPVEAAPSEPAEATQEVTAAVDAVALHPRWPSAPQPEVTAPVDARALIHQPARRSEPEAIGDWTVARPAPAMSTPAVATPVAATAVALAPTAPPSEERTVELAFARPPQLREVSPPTLAPVDEREPLACPPELRPEDSGAAEDSDPKNFSAAEAEREDEVPAPIRPSRAWIVGVVGGLGFLVILLSWGVHSKFFGGDDEPEQKIDGDRDQTSTSSHDPSATTESDGAPPEAETGADDTEAVAETGGTESVPVVEPVETEPKPKNGKPDHRKPENGKPPKDPTCDGVEAQARAANDNRSWADVAKLTARKACWSSQNERIRLRVNALSILGRVDECIEAGAGSSDPKVESVVRLCEAVANKNKAKSP